MAAVATELSFAVQERLRFVETRLLWDGKITRAQVSDVFGISTNHVTRDLGLYEQTYPGSLHYDHRQQVYVPGPKFSPAYASSDPAQYLGLLQTRTETGTTALMPLLGGDGVPTTTLPSPATGIDADVLRQTVRAIRQGCGLTVTYHSLTAEQSSKRRIWPHALANTGIRWYVRAYDENSATFREFALSRMEKPATLDTTAAVSSSTDAGWHTWVTAQVVPHPKLNAHQQRVIACEFAMKRDGAGWSWSLPLRQCLVGYFARRYRLDAPLPVSPKSHWIVLRNRTQLKPWFLPAGSD